jgi:hypothetical protein
MTLAANPRLLQRGVDGSEHRIEVAAETVDRQNNRNRNARCDQSVFNRGSAGFVR